MSIVLPVALAVFMAASPGIVSDGGGVAGGECPAVQPEAASRIRALLTTSLLPELRTRFDLGTATADHVEPLTDERDSEVCRNLWQAVRASGTNVSPGDRLSFYRSGNRFFIPIERETAREPGVVILLDGYSSVDVYDAEFRLVGRFGA